MAAASMTLNDTTLVTSPAPGDMSPIEAAIMDGCNALHHARGEGDVPEATRIRRELFKLLDRYDETDAEGHPNPAWARANQRALVHSAAGELEAAVKFEIAALPYADTPRRKEISLGNLADRCIRSGRFEEAVEWFMLAQEVAPDRVPILLTGIQALCLAGFSAEANDLCESLLDMPGLMQENSELTAYLDYEERLKGMGGELPALGELYRRWNMVKSKRSGASGGSGGSGD